MIHPVSHRLEQVADLIRCELSNLLVYKMRDPRLRGLTVTQVKMSPDLKEARVYYDCEDSVAKREAVSQCLKKSSPFIRRELAQSLPLRQVPKLFFFYDETRDVFEKANEMLDTLDEDDSDES